MNSTVRVLRARWSRFVYLGTRQKLLAVEAAFWLLVAIVAVKLIPFRYWSRFLGIRGATDLVEDRPHSPDTCREVGQAIRRINRVFRGCFTCLMQAAAGKAMLNRRGIPNTLVLGARTVREENSELTMEAHAWLKCGPTILLGGEMHDRFTIVAQFRSPASLPRKEPLSPR